MKFNVKAVGIALGITASLLYLLCISLFAFAPAVIVTIGELIFHGINVEAVPVTPVKAVAGLIVSFAGASLIGFVFASLNNKLSGE